MKIKFNKKGITLVELMASLVLLSVVLVAISVVLASYGGQYTGMTQRLRAQEAASLIAEHIELSVRYSKNAYISVSGESFGCNVLSSDNGRLNLKAEGASEFKPFIEEANYNRFNCNVVFTKESDYCVNAKIIIYKGAATGLGTDAVPEDDYLYSTARTIRLLNTSDTVRGFVTNAIADYDGNSHIFKYK